MKPPYTTSFLRVAPPDSRHIKGGFGTGVSYGYMGVVGCRESGQGAGYFNGTNTLNWGSFNRCDGSVPTWGGFNDTTLMAQSTVMGFNISTGKHG